MSGLYTEGISQVLSGVYSLIQAKLNAVKMGSRGIVAYPFTANWGPINVLTPTVQASEFKAKFNAGVTTFTANKVYFHAFNGNPLEVDGYRMATSAAAKGTCTLNDSGSAKSIELETLYQSDRAFQAVVKDGVGGTKIIQIVESGNKLVDVEDSTLAGLISKLNLSDYVRVKSQGTNLPANNAGTSFSGGNNGSTVTATEYAAFLDTLEADRTQSAFAYDGVSDEELLTTAETWVKRVRTEGFYLDFVRGGTGDWDTDSGAAANTKSKAINHRGIVNVGNGCDGYTAAEMAIYVAARDAAVALNRTLTDEQASAYVTVNKKLKPSDRRACKLAGTLVFVMDGSQVVIDEGVNTLTVPGPDEKTPMGKIRVSHIVDQITKDTEAFGEQYKRDKSNTDEARETFAATVEESYFKSLVKLEVIKPDYSYRPDPDYHGKKPVFDPGLDEAYFVSEYWPVDSMVKIYQKFGVNF